MPAYFLGILIPLCSSLVSTNNFVEISYRLRLLFGRLALFRKKTMQISEHNSGSLHNSNAARLAGINNSDFSLRGNVRISFRSEGGNRASSTPVCHLSMKLATSSFESGSTKNSKKPTGGLH